MMWFGSYIGWILIAFIRSSNAGMGGFGADNINAVFDNHDEHISSPEASSYDLYHIYHLLGIILTLLSLNIVLCFIFVCDKTKQNIIK